MIINDIYGLRSPGHEGSEPLTRLMLYGYRAMPPEDQLQV